MSRKAKSKPAPVKTSPPAVHIIPIRVDSPEGSSEQYMNYLTGLREDNFLDGLIGGGGPFHSGGGWKNSVTGLGTFHRDKVMQGHYDEPNRIDDPQLSALFNGNDLAQRIVMDRPVEGMRRGWCLVIPEDDEDYSPDEGQQGAAERETDQHGIGSATVRGAGNEGGPAAPGAPLVDPMGAAPDNASVAKPENMEGTKVSPEISAAAAGAEYDDPMGINVMKAAYGAKTPVEINMTPASNKKVTPPADDQGDGADKALKIEEYASRLALKSKFLEAKIFGRLYGGGLMIIGADDGQDMSTPLQEDKIKTVRYLTWIDRRFIFASTWYAEIGPKYGEVETWQIVNPFGGQTNTRVHESRCIRFDGAPVDFLMRRRLLGWTLSVLQAPYDVLRMFDMSYQSVSNLMADMSQAVMKINGLAQLISNDQKTLQTRMSMVDISRSTARMLYLDAENEDFKREPTPMTGVADTLEMLMLRVSAAAREPVALLFGREPSGLNATGDADFRRFYDSVCGEQKTDDEPKLRRLYSLICLAKDSPLGGKLPQHGIQFTWYKLYEPSEKEQAEIRWLMAQADDKYVANNTLLPEEVATSRFRSGDLHLDTEIDLELRRESLETAELAPSGAAAAQQEHEQATALASMKLQGGPGGGKPGVNNLGKTPPKNTPSKPRTDEATAWDSARYDSPAEDVYECMSEDFPPEAISWVPDQPWRGPTRVPLDKIDYSNRAKWHASKASEHGRVENFTKMLEDDKSVKPIILIQPPKGKAIIVDGHHRALAHRRAGKEKALAYVAKVATQKGPWDETHAMQRSGLSGASGEDKEQGDLYGNPDPET